MLGVTTAAAYLLGANRSFGYDAAATFANFVATPSLWDAFAIHSVLPTVPIKLVASNDHVLLSLLSHLIYSLTGSRAEVVYRLLPVLAAGGAVGLSTTVLARRFGIVAGVCAGLFIATDPLFVENSRDLRGYSLAALGAVVATLILAGRWTRWRLILYSLVIGLAVAAQLFAAVVLLMHIAWIASRGSWAQVRALASARARGGGGSRGGSGRPGSHLGRGSSGAAPGGRCCRAGSRHRRARLRDSYRRAGAVGLHGRLRGRFAGRPARRVRCGCRGQLERGPGAA